MNDVSEKSLAVEMMFVAGLVVTVAFAWLGVVLGRDLGETRIRSEAIKNGNAEWVADANGKPQFKWKEVK